MKKSTMNAVLSLIADNSTPEAEQVRAEITAELNKGAEKAEANRQLYAGMREQIVEVLRGTTQPVTAQEIAEETGISKGKIVYGLTHLWTEDIEKIEGKTNTYRLRA